jgi:peptide/nickel transport system permease protein
MSAGRRGVAIGGAIVAAMVLLALLAPALTAYGPNTVDTGAILEPPSARHWAGTDNLGRDLFARILYGGRTSLGVAFGIVAIGMGLGALLGCAVGLAGGWVDRIAMRLVDVALAIPSLVIALALAAAVGPSLVNLVLILGGLAVPLYVRLFRSEALSLRERPFVLAARANGASAWRLLWVHILPNIAPLFATLASSALGTALVAASALSFIGLGAQPPTPEWGALIFEGRNTIMYEWWCAVLPGLAVAVSALGFVLLGDGLRDMLDPRGERT